MDCKAPGLPEFESGTELTHCSISALDDTSIQEENSTSDLELSKAFDKLENMKQRALYLRSLLIRPLQSNKTDCNPEMDQMKLEIELGGSENNEMREVQQETARAYQQIDEVGRRLKDSKESLTRLDQKVQRNIRCARKLAKRLLEVPKWQEELKHHTGLCLERYSDLDISRGNYLEYSDNYVRRTQTNMKYCCASKVPVVCYKRDYTDLQNALCRTRKLLLHCHDTLVKHTQHLEEAMTSEMDKKLLPSISEMSLLLEQNSQVSKLRRSSVKVRRSFKFAWAAPLPKQEKHWLSIKDSERDN
ncbi:uncharacterized protein LOC119553957 [Drosophila subpulchrella]|uniref:uncharacterized protein LOC119553957 n=1 Tax=Drosophila subpulchrella TaxID=1486046 RepID=UPI0018A14757|nr:uncharacterized protein LOC119553957 [Drosophila subpulchrella]